MTRRLLWSYVSMTVIVLLCLELPLGVVYARRERDALVATARREATALAVLVGESLENATQGRDLPSLASRYRTQTGTELAVFDTQARELVGAEAAEPPSEEPDLRVLVADALAGRAETVTKVDDQHPQLIAAMPVQLEGPILGVVVVAVPATTTDSHILRAWLALGAFAVALMTLAALLGGVLARSLASPLVALQSAANRFGHGDFEVRAETSGPAEIAALAEDFNGMAQRIHDLVDGQRRFVADASHQLRTPLTALRLRLENLAAGADAETVAELAGAEAETQRLTRLLDGLLALGRAEAQRSERAVIDAVAVVWDRSEAWTPLTEERGLVLRVEANVATAPALAVPGHLEQILDNLLSNAVDASPAGAAITLGVEPSLRHGEPSVLVSVRDRGRGMTAAERERAFDRFWQSADSEGGTGLGLAIVARLAESNGGTVELGPRDGGGLDVRVTIPSTG